MHVYYLRLLHSVPKWVNLITQTQVLHINCINFTPVLFHLHQFVINILQQEIWNVKVNVYMSACLCLTDVRFLCLLTNRTQHDGPDVTFLYTRPQKKRRFNPSIFLLILGHWPWPSVMPTLHFLVDFYERSFLYELKHHFYQFREWNYVYKNVTSGPSYHSDCFNCYTHNLWGRLIYSIHGMCSSKDWH